MAAHVINFQAVNVLPPSPDAGAGAALDCSSIKW